MKTFEQVIIRIILFERVCIALVVDALLPVILPVIEPDKYKQIRWQFFLAESWTMFQGQDTLPEQIRQKLLFAGYLQLAFVGMGLLENILEGLMK